MPFLNKIWKIADPIPTEIDQQLSGYSPILRQLLYNRGCHDAESARRYLQAEPPPGSQPSAMLGMAEAVQRIRSAIQHDELIAIYGDYDVDGVTATALLTQALRALGAKVHGYIPNRFEEGYGVNCEALDTLRQRGVSLVITVDCGIRSPQEAEHARQIGLDLIITDHHQPSDQIPAARAIINPRQPGDTYPDKNLAGVGLAYKLACALAEEAFFRRRSIDPVEFLDLVALGTVADVAPLSGENRSLVRAGLEYLSNPTRQGIASLIGVSQLAGKAINAGHIGYTLAPRLNAAGRLDSAQAALDLLLTDDVNRAAHLAQMLDNQNRERQKITQEIQLQAEEMVLKDDPSPLLIFAAHESFNPGVIGLAASRLQELYYRPAIVAHRGEEFTRGSCRSIPEFHITQALDECADMLVRHGGHAAAAGFTVRTQRLPELVARLKEISRRELGDLDLRPRLSIDMELPLHEVKSKLLLQELALLQPTGHGNPAALFLTRGLKVMRSRTTGREETHLKLTVNANGITYDAIAFRQGARLVEAPAYIDLVYTYEKNEFNGQSMLQLNVKDWRPAQ